MDEGKKASCKKITHDQSVSHSMLSNLLGNINVVTLWGTVNLDVAGFNSLSQSIHATTFRHALPWPAVLVEDFIHLLQSLTLGLWSGEEDVDEGETVEGGEDHVHLPVDVPEKRRDGKGENAVPDPVGSGREGDGLGADLGWVDLGWVSP